MYRAKSRFIHRGLAQYKDLAFSRLSQKSIRAFSRENTGRYLSALTNDTNSVEENYLNRSFLLVSQVLLFLGSLGMMLWYSWKLALAAILLSLIPIAVTLVTGGKLAQLTEQNQQEGGVAIPSTLSRAITLDHVSYGYEPDKPVLKDVTMTFRPGKTYAIVGGSGSGKSTLLHLLMGASDEYAGSICVDGVELRQVSTHSLYDLVSLIGQEVFLFDDTIYNNLTMFRSFPPEEVARAVERSGLSGLLRERGESYRCGENGGNLSGGEGQRISIARCLLRKTPVLLLDEATAALDNTTAAAVTQSILDLEGVTRIVVTHRLEQSLMQQYDEIIV